LHRLEERHHGYRNYSWILLRRAFVTARIGVCQHHVSVPSGKSTACAARLSRMSLKTLGLVLIVIVLLASVIWLAASG
jgi:hypothetical protein